MTMIGEMHDLPYTYVVDGVPLTNKQIRLESNWTETFFGVLRRGMVVYKIRWLSIYHAVYDVDSEHSTEDAAKLRVNEIIRNGMAQLSRSEREYANILVKWDRDSAKAQEPPERHETA
jgi:hypothetical protein